MRITRILCSIAILFMGLFISVGYAFITTGLDISGNIQGNPPAPVHDVYISNAIKTSGTSVNINSYTSTILSTSVTSNGSSILSITILNVSEKDYVFVGVVEGKNIGVDGVYVGEDITYKIEGLSRLQQIDKLTGKITFNLTIISKNNVETDNFLLKFNFVEKTGSEILPGGEEEDDTPVQLISPVVTVSEYGEVSWFSVENASSYKYKINGGAELSVANVSNILIRLESGDYIEVKSVGDGVKYLDSEYSLPVTYTAIIEPDPELIKLPTPIVEIGSDGVASWKSIDNAIGYVYVIDDGENITTNSLSVKLIYNQSIKVMAVGDGVNYLNSDYSETKTLMKPVFNNDFLGLSQVLLSNQTNCLNSNSDIIYEGVRGSIGNAPNGETPALHCEVTSISGGTMSKITLAANKNLSAEVQYIIEPDIENSNKMYLYMYYKSHCVEKNTGEYILVYMQVIVRDSADSKWYADATFIGKALVGDYFGGGKNGKSILTIGVDTWEYGAPES